MLAIEKKQLSIGFIPLTDCAPLVVAKEQGFFERWGLDVTLEKQSSWATLRDKLHASRIDAAHMLAPMPIASTLGLGTQATPVITPLVLSLNGNGMTISNALYQEITELHKLSHVTLPMAAFLLKNVIEARKVLGKPKLRFASVFPYSCHFYQLRDWLSFAAINLDDVELTVVPPIHMVDCLQSGEIDCFCVGGPWNAKAVRAGAGVTVLTSFDIWQDSPEKVLGLLESFQKTHPKTVLAMCGALQQACDWLATVPNRFEAARIMSKDTYLHTSIDVIAPSLLGSCLTQKNRMPRSIPSYNQFSTLNSGSINTPELIRGEWLLKHMLKAGQVSESDVPEDLIRQVFRPDIYAEMDSLLNGRNESIAC